jgi:hypothetical protein
MHLVPPSPEDVTLVSFLAPGKADGADSRRPSKSSRGSAPSCGSGRPTASDAGLTMMSNLDFSIEKQVPTTQGRLKELHDALHWSLVNRVWKWEECQSAGHDLLGSLGDALYNLGITIGARAAKGQEPIHQSRIQRCREALDGVWGADGSKVGNAVPGHWPDLRGMMLETEGALASSNLKSDALSAAEGIKAWISSQT